MPRPCLALGIFRTMCKMVCVLRDGFASTTMTGAAGCVALLHCLRHYSQCPRLSFRQLLETRGCPLASSPLGCVIC